MWKSFRVGSIFGIPLKLDVTFLLILPVFAAIIGYQIDLVADLLNELWLADIDIEAVSSGYRPWILGFVAAVGLFVGVIFHELGHSLVAIRYGFEIESITLWLLGGVAAFADMPEDWRQEFTIALAGPVVSIAVGFGSYGLFLLTPSLADAVGPAVIDGMLFVFAYLAILNVFLAGFNLLPAFPMDGGRILRALLARNRPFARATQQAASIGRAFAIVFGLFGLLVFNIILIALAFFIYIAASGEEQHVLLRAAFEGVTVGDIMTPRSELRTVEPATDLEELTRRMFRERHTGYPVTDDGRLVGLITLEDLQQAPVPDDQRFVGDVMTIDLETIESSADVTAAIDQMQRGGFGRLLVVDDGELVGLISRTDVMTALRIIQQRGPMSRADVHLPATG